MNKLASLIACALFPIIAGSSAGRTDIPTLYKTGILFQENSKSALSKAVQDFTFHAFQESGCNPNAQYKLSNQTSYELNDVNGEKITVYKVEYRVFGEVNQDTFNGYDHGKKFRAREFTVHQSSQGLAMANMSCENNGWQRKQI